jgi:hypothetical protein
MPMRILIAGLVMALLTASAQAQMGGPQNSQMQGASAIGQAAGRTNEQDAGQKPKANDKAYNAVLKNLPDKQYDPWHGVR